ncbi:transposase [Pontiella agarivorans]|uniref:Transposase n=1 Tax=Pontiella agarivorans TaxID=3038953 RepID=A0ABU5MZI9_9BACT|nr:transposase [Pontiella agarivorans]MDZ8119381.1 transposase [Pontiella agarivorans]
MGRVPRIEFAGALYHVMSRGNRQSDIFLNNDDYTLFMSTLDEACNRTGWKIHAFVLMRNHYHFLLETPEPNLVDGMRWLQGTYTKRFNIRYKLWGHLFQGRYKALVVDPQQEYFRTVGNYIHLNPARAHCFDPKNQLLQTFEWSSYPLYLSKDLRPDWLDVNRLLGAHGLEDSPSGLSQFAESTQARATLVAYSDNPAEFDEAWSRIRRGWAFGDDAFRESLQERIGERLTGNHRSSYSGEAIQMHDICEAERLLEECLKKLHVSRDSLPNLKKSDPAKKVIAWHIRKRVSIRNQWISEQLHLGNPSNLSRFCKEVAESKDGPLLILKNKITKK